MKDSNMCPCLYQQVAHREACAVTPAGKYQEHILNLEVPAGSVIILENEINWRERHEAIV
ncbi:MAG: hypothetical protein CMJ99_06155 [Planctomycetes bacterium]|nr:hypothetical protein [Planctomycetota bacterium]